MIVKKKILAVDDSQTNLLLLRGILEEEGYEVSTAESASIALEVLNRKNPDLIILDIMMPEVDGFDLLKNLKSNAKYKKVPVIMLTARGDLSFVEKARNLGASDYIYKPIDVDEIKIRLSNFLK